LGVLPTWVALPSEVRLRAVPPTVVKLPPSRILPCACTATIDDAAHIGIETWIERAIGIEPGNVVACLTQYGGEETSDDGFSIWLHGDGLDLAADGRRIERIQIPWTRYDYRGHLNASAVVLFVSPSAPCGNSMSCVPLNR